MAAPDELVGGSGVELYRDDVVSSKTETNLEAAAVAGNLIGEVSDLDPFTATRGFYERNYFGTETPDYVPGRLTFGTMSFTIDMIFSDTLAKAIRDDDKKTEQTYILKFIDPGTSTDFTLAAFDGIVAEAKMSTDADNVTMLEVVVQPTSDWTIVDNS